MEKYTVKFYGRQADAIGITYDISRTVEFENTSELLNWLYTYYSHISRLEVWKNNIPLNVESVSVSGTLPADRIKITSLSVTAKEWFDKVNGNSYFSARINVNAEVLYLPFQYGYESAYIQAANQALKNAGYEVGANWNIEKWIHEQGIAAQFIKIDNCLQRDVKAWGKGSAY